jgi:hypothetical protein
METGQARKPKALGNAFRVKVWLTLSAARGEIEHVFDIIKNVF